MSKKILFVDDEVQILRSLFRLFMETDFEVFTAESAKEALDILAQENIDIIISDMRMPLMDGYQLLSQVKEKYPHVLRVILSGYSDEKTLFNALQKNIAKLYLLKPWQNEQIIGIIENLLATEESITDSEFFSSINSLEELPTIQSTYQEIMNCIDQDDGIDKVVRIIEQDPAIASKVLHIANSAFYGIKTGSIKQAVTYLGMENIRNIVLSTFVIQMFESNICSQREIDLLWSHSFLCNKIVSLVFNKFLQKKVPKVGMSAGLLHDVGIIFLLNYFQQEYWQFYKEMMEKKENNLCVMESSRFSIDHQQVGGYLLNWWEIPYPIVEAALYHHDPLNEKVINKELVCAVHIGDKYSWSFLEHGVEQNFDQRAFDFLQVDQGAFERELKEINLGR